MKDTSSWNNKKELAEAEQANCDQLAAGLAELDEEEMAARVARATAERDAAQEAHDRCVGGGVRGRVVCVCGVGAGCGGAGVVHRAAGCD